MLAGARRQRPLVRQRLQLPDAGRRGLATATFAKPALLSRIYAPTSKVDRSQGTETLRSVDYLIKAGFIRQSSAGIYSLLPFGQRVLEKLEKIIEHEMYSLDASKVSLPNLLPPALWKRSGRWDSTGNELWRLQDRRKTEMLLAPTHEEEITALVSDDVLSEKALPVRLFQIGRKFRDEARPRAGLLRGREFLMKDLYTFDATLQDAEHSYDDAKAAYCRIFDAIGLPYRVAVADTGNIGGTASHEFHYVSPAGEDTLITCRTCATSANSEMARSAVPLPSSLLDADHCTTTLVDLPDTRSLGIAITRNQDSLNLVKIRKRYPNARTVLLGRPLDDWNTLSVLLDEACASVDEETAMELVEKALGGQSPRSIWPQPPSYEVTDLRTARDKDACVQCNRPLLAETSIEIGHTFLLGTKYSEALDASFARSGAGTGPQPQPRAFFQMGCYGIGVSRLLGSIAEVCADAKGLVWPVAVAPYEVCILATSQAIAREVLATLPSPDPSVRAQEQDVIIDDRYEMSFGKRMKDGELSGYPFLVIAGRHWQQEQKLEVQVRSTGDSTLCTAENLLALLADCRASASGARLRSSGSLWNRPR